ncbi:uncharacterized protein LOC142330427 [Lycorma delicatula]|uniref:uncharacterized protein LOC142330427 n=1 Tax=Lycorma delicatula TaxID=130591 RepID=UPI003F51323A
MAGSDLSLTKAYIALFICLATKAIHLELVSDLSSQSFITALKRFISHRGGISKKIFFDNGTNFHSAKNILYNLYQLFKSDNFKSNIQSFSTKQDFNWSFIPPASLHIGGLWESAIKSVKHLTCRVIGQIILNFEELYTILTQTEACLPPIPYSVSTDHRNRDPLTPGHFLIGSPFTSLPEPSYQKISRSSRTLATVAKIFSVYLEVLV